MSGKDERKATGGVTDREVRAHILRKLKEALPKGRKAERAEKDAGDR
ncbi:hypothetical protein ACFOYU_11435 [Microvirga sp. GCM10011540]